MKKHDTQYTINARALTEVEASRYVGMSRSFLRQARCSGNRKNRTPAPRFIKIGRAVRYLQSELDRWLDEHINLEHTGQALPSRINRQRRGGK